MPASPGSRPPIGARPSSPTTPAQVAEWEARSYRRLARYAPPLDGDTVLDDVLPDGDEMLADPELARDAIVDELGRP